MNIKSIVFSCVILSGIFFVACKDGEIGPQGQKGETGIAGATGAAGVKGDKGATGDTGNPGANGNFNVIVKDLGGGEIAAGTNGAGYSWLFVNNDLPAALVENSAVYMYLKTQDDAWYVLPGDVWSIASNSWHSFAMRIYFENNRADTRFRITRTKGTGIFTFNAARILLVPRVAGARQANVDHSNYAAVKAFYNIED